MRECIELTTHMSVPHMGDRLFDPGHSLLGGGDGAEQDGEEAAAPLQTSRALEVGPAGTGQRADAMGITLPDDAPPSAEPPPRRARPETRLRTLLTCTHRAACSARG